jgi:hypothetical protein
MIKRSIKMVVGENKKNIWIVITFMLSILVLFSGCININCAYIPDSVNTGGWIENLSLRNTGSQFLGLEKWCGSVYEINSKYPAYLTVTTLKTLVLNDEEELQRITIEIIENTFQDSIQINENTKITGERTLQKTHKTMYMIYNGKDITNNNKIKIIGEVWNCGTSGISIICIGIAYISSNDNPTNENTENWRKIVMDPNGTIGNFTGEEGLIYNIYCH